MPIAMSGINRDLEPDIRHIAKHLPDTPQMQRLLLEAGSAHVFNNLETLQTVAQAIIDRGESIGNIRGHERYQQFQIPNFVRLRV
jgi:hypothetical protein